eukprot:07383_5
MSVSSRTRVRSVWTIVLMSPIRSVQIVIVNSVQTEGSLAPPHRKRSVHVASQQCLHLDSTHVLLSRRKLRKNSSVRLLRQGGMGKIVKVFQFQPLNVPKTRLPTTKKNATVATAMFAAACYGLDLNVPAARPRAMQLGLQVVACCELWTHMILLKLTIKKSKLMQQLRLLPAKLVQQKICQAQPSTKPLV